MEPSISAVSVLVIDCTTIGAPPPTATWPTLTWVVLCRGCGPATSIWDGYSGLFMASRISGFWQLQQWISRIRSGPGHQVQPRRNQHRRDPEGGRQRLI